MPFNSTDLFNKKEAYFSELKSELRKLDEGALGDFWFFDGVEVNGSDAAVILVGKFKTTVANTLKKESKSYGTGKCFREGSILNMTLSTGKMPEAKLKPLFKETKNFGFKIVKGDLTPAGPGATDEKKVREIVGRLEIDFDKIKGEISDENRKTLRVSFGKISDALENNDFEGAKKTAFGLEKAMKNFVEQAKPGATTPDSREKTNAETRWKTTMARFEKIEGKIAEEDRTAINANWKIVDGLMKKEDWGKALAAIDKLDRDMVVRVKKAVEVGAQAAKSTQQKVESKIDDADTNELKKAIDGQAEKLDKLLNVMAKEMAELEELRDDLRTEQRKEPPDEVVVVKIKKQLDAKKKRVEAARKAAGQQRKSYDIMSSALKRRKSTEAKELMAQLDESEEKMSALEEMLDSPSLAQASDALRDTVKKMAEATAWREQQLKKEEGGSGHATGRHGAQTGLERQARRAATTEMDTSGKKPKAKKGTGITPDQKKNAGGTAQTVTWNKVKFTYTEEDGKRVIKDRVATAKQIVGVPNRTGGSDTGSMWATPVLEKESFDTANSAAQKLKKFTHYKKKKGWGDFTKLVIKMPKPTSSPGWGYAVTKKDTAGLDPADAEKILKLFEHGKISLDRLFKEMNVKLLTEEGDTGAKMVEHATVVFKRANGGDDWKMVTQYPDDGVKAGDVGWRPYDNPPPATLILKEADNSETPLSTKSLP